MNHTAVNTCDLADLLQRLPFLSDIDPAGKRVFVRADFNVPIDDNGNMVDDGRFRAVLPTMNYLLDRGASVVVGSHARNPLESGVLDTSFSFAPLARRLSRIWEVDVAFSPSPMGPTALSMAQNLEPGRVLLLENLRFHEGEMSNSCDFANELASLADIYVNDAFGVCHRPHASMTGIVGFMKEAVGGLALKNELQALHRALGNPIHPFGAVIGGRHIEAKLPVVTKLMGLADYVILGGRMGDAVSRLAFGQDISHLHLSTAVMQQMELMLSQARALKAKLFLPIDSIVITDDISKPAIVPVQNLTPAMLAEDIGPATRVWYEEVLSLCRTIVWNGPMGAYEIPAFTKGTAVVTKALAECQGVTLAGGVDTSAAIVKMSDRSQVSFLSAGGSAFLAALAGQPLVALEALRAKQEQ